MLWVYCIMLPVRRGFCDVPHVYYIMLPVQGGFCDLRCVHCIVLPVQGCFLMYLICTVLCCLFRGIL